MKWACIPNWLLHFTIHFFFLSQLKFEIFDNLQNGFIFLIKTSLVFDDLILESQSFCILQIQLFLHLKFDLVILVRLLCSYSIIILNFFNQSLYFFVFIPYIDQRVRIILLKFFVFISLVVKFAFMTFIFIFEL